jgi:hypothetical protein
MIIKRNLWVGDWLGEEPGNMYWSDDKLQKVYQINRKRLKDAIKTVRRRGWNDTFVKNGCCNPTSILVDVNVFKKEIIRRKKYNKYFGVK